MSWFLRVVEEPGGGWVCRHGRDAYDAHVDLAGALEHIQALARDLAPSEIFVLYADGHVVRESELRRRA